MTDSIYAPPKSHLGTGEIGTLPMFYVVSPLKMMVLFLATMGGYALYWHYQNWFLYKTNNQSPDDSVMPIVRTIFAIFYTHALLEEVEAHAKKSGHQLSSGTGMATAMIVLLSIIAWVPAFVPVDSQYSLMASVFGLIIVVPLMFAYRAAQRLINESCGDPRGQGNASFTAANGAWIVFGALIWLLTIIGTIHPEAAV